MSNRLENLEYAPFAEMLFSLEHRRIAIFLRVRGGPGRIRTYNQQIMSLLL
jgi:hypothetical protein